MLEKYWPGGAAVLKKSNEQFVQEIEAGTLTSDLEARFNEILDEKLKQHRGLLNLNFISDLIITILFGVIIGLGLNSWFLGWPQTQEIYQNIVIGVGIFLLISIIISVVFKLLLKKRLS